MLRRLAAAAALAALVVACSASTEAPDEAAENTGEATSELTTDDAVSRAEQWVAVKLHYCQAPYGARDYDSACSTYCNRESNTKWNPYRSDCSGLVSWAWGLPAPGRVTGQFAPFQKDITKVIDAKDLAAGDAVNNSDHIMLFKAWVTPGKKATFIEEPGCSVSQPYAREWSSDVTINGSSIHVAYNGMDFTAIRYSALSAPKPPTPPSTGGTAGTAAPPPAATNDPAADPAAPAAPAPASEGMGSLGSRSDGEAQGCSVAIPKSRSSYGAVVAALAVLGLAGARRRRR